ncbi:hypothetical protein IIV25_089R [Invertebrate iridovirus 25]|uniref:Uncharacterized protein n=1 Tax=Invertebrate iridovirus 25 TaxID=1301280 RepID=W8W1J7_9VIRU|nr:hypothetical protein IIV25_089R [Invertebrate iridovirus 25]CCV02107.1 hypothetical protein IIV25_089R [Invertebrate iridovirus 25]
MALIESVKQQWKSFFDDHYLEDEIKDMVYFTIDNLTLKDIEIVVTNHNSKDLETGPRSYSEFTIGSLNCALYCGGYEFNNGDKQPSYDLWQDKFYNEEKFTTTCINPFGPMGPKGDPFKVPIDQGGFAPWDRVKELIFISLFEECEQFIFMDEEEWWTVDPRFEQFFQIKFIEVEY